MESPQLDLPESAPLAIDVRRLVKRFGPMTAVEDVSFSVAQGEIVGFLGPNGAGKSTTMRILAGLMVADAGEAYVAGENVALHPERIKARLAYMPENNPLPEDMRVQEYLRFRAKLKRIPRQKRGDRIRAVMEQCDLQRKARRKLIGTLSKGFRQRVGIADALLAEPDVIIMDEPTIGLDPHQIQAMRTLISSLRGKISVILSSHILPEIEACCDKVVIINHGRVVADGTTEDLRETYLPGRRYELVTNRAGGDLVDLLKQRLRCTCELEERGDTDGSAFTSLSLTSAPGKELRGESISKLLTEVGGCQIRELRERVPTLEEIFIQATRRSWEEHGVPKSDTQPPFPLSDTTTSQPKDPDA